MISRISSLGRNVIHLTLSSAPWHIGAHASVPPFSVLSGSAALATDAAGMPYYDVSSAVDFAAKTLERWLATARGQGVACDALVREGNPAQQIISSVRQFSVDRILLGTRSRSKISKLLLGSVAEQVLRSVNIPVITVGPEAHLGAAGSNGSNRVVLHATTLRETSSPSAVLAGRRWRKSAATRMCSWLRANISPTS